MRRRMWVVALALAVPSTAWADDLELQVKNKVQQGKGKPALELKAHAAIAEIQVDLTGGASEIHVKLGPVRSGWHQSIPIDPGPKSAHLTGTVKVHYPPKEGKEDVQMDLDFEAEVVVPPAVEVKPDEVDVEHHKLTATFNRAAAKAHLQVTGDDGQSLADEEMEMHGEPAETPLNFEWSQRPGSVLKIHLRLDDADGFFAGIDLFPWRVDIPHAEVGFASGSSAVPAADGAKLDESLALIQAAVKKAGRFADIRVYVAGHTDTVGAADDNQRLSEARARSIGEYFRSHGLKVPISFAGFGEKALAVQTADEVAEPRNRRAEYIVAITDPTIAHASSEAHWKHL